MFFNNKYFLKIIDKKFWKELAEKELQDALKVKWNLGVARNVILFIGDGMGPSTVTAARIHKAGETGHLQFETLPHMGLLKTYSSDKMVPDSASTATALFTGVKVNQETIGVDATVKKDHCNRSLVNDARLPSLAVLASEVGKSSGFVTTMRVTHATPSPWYAHSANRRWECESAMPDDVTCKDIARQLVEDSPGKDLKVILGGGRQTLVSNVTSTPTDPLDTWSCRRNDGRDLIEEYIKDKEARELKYSVIKNNEELNNLNIKNTDYLLGIFANSHLQLEHERDKSPKGMPSLSEMVEVAIKVLEKNKKGYFLMVEGGNIDMAHHRGKAKKAISETIAFDEAVGVAMEMTNEKDTLLIVTSDHGHSLTINGYPLRGSNIFGIAKASPYDGINYTTLAYGTGGPNSVQYHVLNDTVVRDNPINTDSYEYEQTAAIPLDENAHSGSDVAVYARGPYSHLFHKIHEQNYVFEAISYAAKVGAYSIAHTHYCNFILIILTFIITLNFQYCDVNL